MPELQLKVITKNESTNQEIVIYKENPIYEIIEAICISWFTLEFVLRLLSCPNKIKFVANTLNIIDFCSVIPFFISQLFDSKGYANLNDTKRILTLFKVLRILRMHLNFFELK